MKKVEQGGDATKHQPTTKQVEVAMVVDKEGGRRRWSMKKVVGDGDEGIQTAMKKVVGDGDEGKGEGRDCVYLG